MKNLLSAILLCMATCGAAFSDEVPEASEYELARYALSVRVHSYLAAARPDLARRLKLAPEVAEKIGAHYREMVRVRMEAQDASGHAWAVREQQGPDAYSPQDAKDAARASAELAKQRSHSELTTPRAIHALLSAEDLTNIGKLVPPSPKETRLTVEIPKARSLAYVDAGSQLAVATQSELSIFDLAENKRLHVLALPERPDLAHIDHPTILAANGTVLKVIVHDRNESVSHVLSWDAASGLEPDVVDWPENPKAFNARVALDRTGARIAIFENNSRRIYSTTDATESHSIDERIPASALAFSPDGRTLAIGDYKGTVRFWDLDAKRIENKLSAFRETRHKHTGTTPIIRHLAFSNDGKRLAVTSDLPNVVKIFDVSDGSMQAIVPVAGKVIGSQFAHDDKLLVATSDKTVTYWDIEKQEERAVHLRPSANWNDGSIFAFALHPKGTDVAILLSGRTTEVVRLAIE